MTRPSSLGAGPPWSVLAEFAEKYQGPPAQADALERLERMLELARTEEAAARKLIREWSACDLVGFVPALVQVIKRLREEDALALLPPLVPADALLAALLEPSWCVEQDAHRLLRRLEPWLPNLDLHIARRVFGDPAESKTPVSSATLGRAVGLLAARQPDQRVLRLLMRACQSGDPRVISQAALLARRYPARRLLLPLLAHPDARVRANAVESLAAAPHVIDRREMLWRAAGDEHHRVAVNALVALARLGDPEALGRLEILAEHPQPEFRAAAAWGMGELGDPRFDSTLNRLRQDEAGIVRRNALRALVRLRKARARGPVNGTSGA